MRVFVTGGTGFIGSAIIQDLLTAGHQVLGLARSDASAEALLTAGAEVHRGDLPDTVSLEAGARACDGVIHAGYIHDFANIAASGRVDLRADRAAVLRRFGAEKYERLVVRDRRVVRGREHRAVLGGGEGHAL